MSVAQCRPGNDTVSPASPAISVPTFDGAASFSKTESVLFYLVSAGRKLKLDSKLLNRYEGFLQNVFYANIVLPRRAAQVNPVRSLPRFTGHGSGHR